MAEHKSLNGLNIHTPITWTYANATERTSATGFNSSDIGKFSYQSSDGSVWVLTSTTPTWGSLGGQDLSIYALNCTSQHSITDYEFLGTEQRNGGYLVSTTGGNRTIDIDADLFSTGYEVSICKGTNDANIVTLDAQTGNNIDGSQTYILRNYNETITLVKDGANTWKIKSSHFPNGLKTDSTNISGATNIANIVQISQADYDLLTPNANTVYIING